MDMWVLPSGTRGTAEKTVSDILSKIAQMGKTTKNQEAKTITRDEAISLRYDYGLSERCIVNRLHVPQPTIHYWVNNNSRKGLINNSNGFTHLEGNGWPRIKMTDNKNKPPSIAGKGARWIRAIPLQPGDTLAEVREKQRKREPK